MPRAIRFHLDEHCDFAIARGLRRRGVDVTTAVDAGLLGAEDEDHLAFALTRVRTIFTKDADFLRLNATGIEHAGIIYSPQGQATVREVIRGLALIWEVYEPEDLRNRVEYL